MAIAATCGAPRGARAACRGRACRSSRAANEMTTRPSRGDPTGTAAAKDQSSGAGAGASGGRSAGRAREHQGGERLHRRLPAPAARRCRSLRTPPGCREDVPVAEDAAEARPRSCRAAAAWELSPSGRRPPGAPPALGRRRPRPRRVRAAALEPRRRSPRAAGGPASAPSTTTVAPLRRIAAMAVPWLVMVSSVGSSWPVRSAGWRPEVMRR